MARLLLPAAAAPSSSINTIMDDYTLHSTASVVVCMNTAKRIRRMLGIMVIASLLVWSCQKTDITSPDELTEYLQEEMEAERIPALAVLAFNQNKIVYENYLGKAQLQQNIALESDHLFLLASVSKVVTATALLQLMEDGMFQLDDHINNYLPFEVKVPGTTNPITFRMLLTHTSGIADGSVMDDHYYYGADSPIPLSNYLQGYLVPGGAYYNAEENYYRFEPGTKHRYTNMGNALIAVLVETLTGQDFNSYCKQHIFEPLGMENTFWRLDEISSTIVQPYHYKRGNFEPIEHYTFTDYPNGGLRSTARDLHKLFAMFVQAGRSNDYQVLAPGTIELMHTPQIPQLDEEVGLHLFLLDRQHQLWGHDGGEAGVATIVAYNKQTGVGVIILANEGDAFLDDMLAETYALSLTL